MRLSHLLRLSFLAVLPVLCNAQSTKPPLTKIDVLGQLAAGSSRSNIAYLVKTRGINFSPDSSYFALISRAGGNGILLQRLSAATPNDSSNTFSGDEPQFTHLGKCAELLQLGDFDSAKTECRTAIKENPKSPWPLLAAVRALQGRQDSVDRANTVDEADVKDAAEFARRASDLSPDPPVFNLMSMTSQSEDPNYIKGLQRSQSSDPESNLDLNLALSFFDDNGRKLGGQFHTMEDLPPGIKRLLKLEPDYAEAHLFAAGFYYVHNQLNAARAEGQKMLDLEPDNAMFHDVCATFYEQQGDTGNRIVELREEIRIEPYARSHRQALASTLFQLGRVQEALKEFQDFVALRPQDSWASSDLVDALVNQKQLPEAIEELRRYLRATSDQIPNQPSLPADSDPRAEQQAHLGRLLHQTRQLDAAAYEYLEVLRIHPDSATVINDYGNVLLDQGKVEEAAAQYREALRLNPNMSVAHNNLALCLARKNQFDGAITEFRTALENNPAEPHSRAYLGFAYASKGDFGTAISELNKAIEENPKDVAAHIYLGRVYLMKNDPAEGISELKRSLELEPENPETLNGLAWTYATVEDKRYRDPVAALKLAKQADQLSNHSNAAYIDTLAEALLLNNQPTEALANEEKALQLDPTNPELQNRIQRFRDAIKSPPTH